MTRPTRRLVLLSLVIALAPVISARQKPAVPFTLTVDNIMRGPELVGYPPSGLRWSGDTTRLYFEWRLAGDTEPSTWVVGRDGGEPRRLSDEERRSAPPVSDTWDREHRRALAVQDGDIVVIDSVVQKRLAITRTTGNESSPRWARDDTHVTFVRDGQVFLAPAGEARDSVLLQLADIGPKKNEPEKTASQKFLEEEELKLLEATKAASERKKREEERRKRHAPPKLELPERHAAIDARLAPGDTTLFVLVAERQNRAKTAAVPNYATESAYTENIETRTKVGDAQENRKLAILDLESGKHVWAKLPDEIGRTTDARAAGEAAQRESDAAQQQSDAALKGSDAAQKEGEGSSRAADRHVDSRGVDNRDEPRERLVQWSLPAVSAQGHAVAVARAADNKDRWIVVVDPATGSTRVLERLHDDAWVRDLGGQAGPGASTALGWLEDQRTLWFTSERDGWMHLYTVDVTATDPRPRQLTSGPWEITNVDLSTDRRTFYLTSTEIDAGERHLFTMPATGGARTRITTRRGAHAATVSPDGAMLAIVSSAANEPPALFLASNKPGAESTRVTRSTSDEWRAFKWQAPQVVRYKARDGVMVPARLYTPEMLGAKRDPRRPAVVFIHGAGYAQNAHAYWSSYYREYMFHHLLASRGYVVLDVDYRASAGYGRDWRTAIYRHMGGKDLEDVVDGAKYLADAHRVDPKRIGVYGGSYGGFLTLMAMFTSPKTFAAGAALRPVTDWAHYNHRYTANILNVPQEDAEAYRRSSPIYFAEGLEGALLICHGMVDTNVHFQDSVRLAQRLIELRKERWELALYPVENHGFEKDTSWADEYKRILKLFETTLRAS